MEPGVLIVILIVTFVVITLRMLVLWVISLFLADVSIVDIFWGPGLAITAARLAVHLARRNLGRGEDYRYRTMRERHGSRFPLVSLGTVFLLQALLMWIVSWPLQAVHGPQAADSVGWADAGGLVLWIAGLTFEATADVQLARFKRAPESAGQVMDRGLWRYSRHPNYFGDCLAWWGFGLWALAAGAAWALISPALMTVLLVKVSGVALLESTIAERRPAYRAYVQRTSAFVPLPPRRAR